MILKGKHYSLGLGHLFLPSHDPRHARTGLAASIPPPGLFPSGFHLPHLSAAHTRTQGKSQPETALPLPRKPPPEVWAELLTQGAAREQDQPGPSLGRKGYSDRLGIRHPRRAGVGPQGSGGGWEAAKTRYNTALPRGWGMAYMASHTLPCSGSSASMWDSRASSLFLE